jgi:hypothetical protein
MRLSRKKLNKIRSGQGVWKVWFRYDLRLNELSPRIEYLEAVGKRINYWQTSPVSPKYNRLAPIFVCERYRRPLSQLRHINSGWTDQYRMPHNKILFIGDAFGDACFTQKRQADRYVAAVLAGQHPSLVQDAIDQAMSDQLFDYMEADYFDNQSEPLSQYEPDEEPPFDPEDDEGARDTRHSLPG